MKKTKEALSVVEEHLSTLRENKGKLDKTARFSAYRYFEGQKLGLELALRNMEELIIRVKERLHQGDNICGSNVFEDIDKIVNGNDANVVKPKVEERQ